VLGLSRKGVKIIFFAVVLLGYSRSFPSQHFAGHRNTILTDGRPDEKKERKTLFRPFHSQLCFLLTLRESQQNKVRRRHPKVFFLLLVFKVFFSLEGQ